MLTSTPVGKANEQVSQLASPGIQNAQNQDATPDPGQPIDYFRDFGVSEDDKNLLVQTISQLRSGWMQDRMERIRTWMLSVMMEKGIQYVGWDQSGNCWYDALAEVRNNGLLEDGESVDLEQWMNNITLMFKQIFVGNLTRAVPHSVILPQNANKPVDVQTAKAAGDVISILDRKNKVRRLMRTIYETLYTFGVYFRYTRGVLDGVENGYDVENTFTDFEVKMPARMKCMKCGTETPIADLPPTVAPGQMNPCPACKTPMGGESYYGAGEGDYTSLQQSGTKKVPRASVRQSIHTPLEIDVDPNVKEWWQSGVLSYDREISFGEALMLFPAFRNKIQPGAAVATTPNSDWERLMRVQLKSVSSGYASDLNQSRPTYSENWMNPDAFYELQKYDFAARMKEMFPEGVKVTMLGETVVDIRPATMRREWSSCRLYESYGPYCPSIAERVVPFNQRFNAAMQMLDSWMQHASTGVNIADGSRLDTQKTSKIALVPGHITAVPMKINGESRPMSEVFAHYDMPMNPAAWSYPNLLLMFCQLIAGMPPQTSGAGTTAGVETASGQSQMLGQATEALQPYWENVKDECAEASYNEIYWVKKLMGAGAMDKMWRAEEAKGAGYRNKQVDWSQMQGEVDIFSDEDQGLPVSPDDLRNAYKMMFEELSKGNKAAQQWFGIPANADKVLSAMVPGSVSPVAAQNTKTQMDIQMLLTTPAMPVQNPDGSITEKLPVMPDYRVEQFDVAKACLQNFMLENNDLRFSNPDAWDRLNEYADALEDADAQLGADRAQRQMKVNQAGQPPKAGPDPDIKATVQELLKQALAMVDQEAKIATTDPILTKGTLTAQEAGAYHVIDTALEAAKVYAGA